MAEVDRDPTDLGLSPLLSDEDLERIRRARRLGRIAADVPSGPPARREHRERVVERVASQHGLPRSRPARRLQRACRWCSAKPGTWCRRGSRGAVSGFVHDDRGDGDSE
jgi:hypothetical protein